VGTEPFQGVVDGPAQVIQERLLRSRDVVVRNRLVQQIEIAGLPDVGRHGEDEPRRIVVEP